MNTSRLYIIDGVSSVWKQDLVKYVEHVAPNATVVRKFSTRSLESSEDCSLLDLEFVSADAFGQIAPDYVYEYADKVYGIQKSRLVTALAKYKHVFVIVRNSEIIQILKSDFARYGPISVFIHMDVSLVSNRSVATKNPVLRGAVKKAFDDYLREPECYDEVMVNGGTQNDFFRLISLLMKRGSGAVLIVRDANTIGRDIFVVSNRQTRRVLQVALTAISTITVGVAVNLITNESGTYWENVSLILDVCLLSGSLLMQVALASCWKEIG